MGHRTDNHRKLTRLFGLVAAAPDGVVVLSRSGVVLAPVLRDLAAGVDGDALFARHPGIKPEEIKTALAYHARFGDDPAHPRALPAGPKAVLLDENIPYTLLPQVIRDFGVCSHVEAEGLSRQNLAPHNRVHAKALDALICTRAVQGQFAAIVTQDSDFLAMIKNPDHPVHGLHVVMIRDARDPVADILTRNAETIRAVVAKRMPGLTYLA